MELQNSASQKKECPRCHQPFPCQAQQIKNCACFGLELSPQTTEFLKNSFYKDCLCKKCLTDLDFLLKLAKEVPFPKNKEERIQGLHGYWEGTKLVSTEFYHLQRGSCCQTGCRHCAYGFIKP